MEIEFLDRFFSDLFNSLSNLFNPQKGIEALYIALWILVPFVILLVVYSVYFTMKMRKKDNQPHWKKVINTRQQEPSTRAVPRDNANCMISLMPFTAKYSRLQLDITGVRKRLDHQICWSYLYFWRRPFIADIADKGNFEFSTHYYTWVCL